MTGADKPLQQILSETLFHLWSDHLVQTAELLIALEHRCGPAVLDVAEEIIGNRVQAHWSKVAKAQNSNGLKDLIRLLWEPLRVKGFDFTATPLNGGIQVKCTRCPLLKLKKEVPRTDWLYRLTCATDYHIVKGFNPAITLHRTKTLMQGDDYCDHFYSLESQAS